MPRKKIDPTKLKHLSFYWVRRSRTPGSGSYPDWQPMLWDSTVNRFFTDKFHSPIRIGDLSDVGERIVRREKRTTRKAWMPLDLLVRGLTPDLNNIATARSNAAVCSDGPPIAVEVSWRNETFNTLKERARKR